MTISKMRKLVLLVIALLLIGFKATAQQRSEQEALQIARDFWGTNGSYGPLSVVKQQKVKAQARRRLAPSQMAVSSNSSFYVVNDETNNRFVIVSSDERFHDILGYSNNGKFDAEMAPTGIIGTIGRI